MQKKSSDSGFQFINEIDSIISKTPVFDIHTHIYDSGFGDLLLWGIDELLTYHYLVAEVFRAAPLPYKKFWAMSKKEQADYIWKNLFIDRSPISESCRGILTCLNELGLDTGSRNLDSYRKFFSGYKTDKFIDLVFEKANVGKVIMTNDPFDSLEKPLWAKKAKRDERFLAALRIDRLLVDWENSCGTLASWGYEVETGLGDWTVSEILRFLRDWIKTMKPVYLAASLPPNFKYPDNSACGKIIDRCILPVCRESGLPFAMMIGVKKLVNKDLGLAGDSVGKSDIISIENICSGNPGNKFLVTMLSRENQHELCVTARKFNNLMIFGCWWFLNNPSIIDEMTRERLELLGFSMVPQHSDARVLDQLIYKWKHSRKIIAGVLSEKYSDIEETGWKISANEIKRDIKLILGGTFEKFLKS